MSEPIQVVPAPAEPAKVVTELSTPLLNHQRDDLLLDMYRRVGRIEANTEHVVNTIGDHEDRIRSVEKRVWQVPGISIFVALLTALGLHPHSL
jgi:hypothetical protein